MPAIERLQHFEQIKLLADRRRLLILRRLMAAPATLTQLGQSLGEHPAWIRHHLKQLEQAGLVEIVERRVTSGVVEIFYRACAGGLLLQELILPENPGRPAVVFSGSHDLAVELLAAQLARHLDIFTLPVGSLDGLVTLRQGLCHLSGTHLYDAASNEFNTSYVRHLFPDRETVLITLAHREQGLMLAPGNPKEIRSLADLTRPDIHFVNRQKGSGTRLWLDNELHRLGVEAEKICGYKVEVRTHTECAAAIQNGRADSGLGLRAAAIRCGLDFLPLFHERYDILYPKELEERLNPILNTIQSSEFRRSVEKLTGYETKHTGEHIPL